MTMGLPVATTLAGNGTPLMMEVHDQGLPADAPVVVLLHGLGMVGDDLTPFARSLGLPVRFVFPQGPVSLPAGATGRSFPTWGWWDVDLAQRARALAQGPRHLGTEDPAGLPAARHLVSRLLDDVRSRWRPSAVVLGGFSQGAMLTCDLVVQGHGDLAAAVLLSASPLARGPGHPPLNAFHSLPVFQSHGMSDPDLSFPAATELRDSLLQAGAHLTWVPFEGGHEIPLVVWRTLKKFLRGCFQGLPGFRNR